jgi:septin family protein
LDQFA